MSNDPSRPQSNEPSRPQSNEPSRPQSRLGPYSTFPDPIDIGVSNEFSNASFGPEQQNLLNQLLQMQHNSQRVAILPVATHQGSILAPQHVAPSTATLLPTQGTMSTMTASASSSAVPEEWKDIDPDCIIDRLKKLPSNSIGSNEKPFYKSYSTWNKLSIEQRNKATAWFRKLEQSTRREFILILFYFYY